MPKQLGTELQLALATSAIIALSGCATGVDLDEAPADGDQQLRSSKGALTEQAAGKKLVYTLDLGQNHILDFYESPYGHSSVRERAPIDVVTSDERHIIDGLSGGATLADVYRLANPTASQVPQEIIDADARVAAARAALPPQGTPKSMSNDRSANDMSADDSRSALPIQEIAKAATCTGDLLHDNYGAQWFMNNYCVGGDARWCYTNRTSGYIERDDVNGFKWTVMAADFAAGGHITLWVLISQGIYGTFWWPDIDEDVPHRTVTWYYDSAYSSYQAWATGEAACRKLHYAAVWWH